MASFLRGQTVLLKDRILLTRNLIARAVLSSKNFLIQREIWQEDGSLKIIDRFFSDQVRHSCFEEGHLHSSNTSVTSPRRFFFVSSNFFSVRFKGLDPQL